MLSVCPGFALKTQGVSALPQALSSVATLATKLGLPSGDILTILSVWQVCLVGEITERNKTGHAQFYGNAGKHLVLWRVHKTDIMGLQGT